MIPSRNKEAQESFKRENTAEGWDGVESRDTPGPEEPAGIEDSDTGSHVPPESLQEPGRETSASLCALPDTSPPAEATKAKKKKSSKRLTSEPGGSPSAKKRDVSTEPSDTKIKTETSSDLLDYTFLLDICDNQNNIKTDKISESLILEFTRNILIKRKEELSNIKDTQLPREKGDNYTDIKKQFLKMFEESEIKDSVRRLKIQLKIHFSKINVRENRIHKQYAFAFIKFEDNSSTKVIGLCYRGDSHSESHSEDTIIEKVTEIIEENKKNISEIWIYTMYNPCIGRKNHTPCMYNLLSLSQNHKFKMYICFTEYYICHTKMDNIFKKSKELGNYIMEIIEAYDLNPQSKFSVTFIKEYNIIFTKCMKNIPEDKKKVVHKNKISPKSLDLELTYNEWKQKIIETAEQLVSEMKEKVKEIIGESFKDIESHYDEFKSAIKKHWVENISRSVLIYKQFIEFIKEKVVLHYLEEIQRLEHPPVIFQIDLHNLHHEE